MPTSTIFVGSSSETKGLIRGLGLNLEDEDVALLNWAATASPPSRDALLGVERSLEKADFAAFILAADDVAYIRGEKVDITRDNVLLELGMSFGKIGRDRTFILAPRETKSSQRTPSDLLGLTAIHYGEGKNREAMAGAASKILEQIEELGPMHRPGGDGALERGATTQIDSVVDGAMHVFASRAQHYREFKEAVLDGETVPAKFQFAEAEGGRRWLKLCKSRNYKYFTTAKAQIRTHGGRLAEQVRKAAGTTAVDLVSLGSGDGKKDDILLHALADDLSGHDHAYYYPIDISDILLVEAVRYVSHNGLKKERFRCKPVLGDFTNLSSLEGIISHRPNTNLFSLLGNALGSFDESEILDNIKGAMCPGDLILLEANIGELEDSVAMFKSRTASQWDLSTLDALKIDHESCELKQEESPEQISVVPKTKTLVSYAVPNEDRDSKYMLSAVHHYDFDELKKCVQEQLNVELIDDVSGNGVGLLLGRRAG